MATVKILVVLSINFNLRWPPLLTQVTALECLVSPFCPDGLQLSFSRGRNLTTAQRI
jgi:hypothetical protein